MKTKVLTRREFLQGTTSAALAGALYLSAPEDFISQPEERMPQPDRKTRVVLIRNREVLDDLNRPREAVVRRMLDEAVTALMNEDDPVRAWQRLIKPDDIVGIKTNGWRFLSTTRELETAIKDRVRNVGVPEQNVGIRDRDLLSDAIFLNATALINARPLRTHHWSGVGSLIKNYITFVEKPSDYHPDSCADLASIWKLPLVRGKTRLNVLVLFTPLFHGIGPHHFNPKYTWTYKGLLVGLDPVAVDATGVRILLAKREEFFGEVRPLNPPPKHIFQADARHRLGTADPENIDLIKIGWKDGILI